jgi:hypothetical protein
MPSPTRPGPLGIDSNNCGIDLGTLMRVVTPCPTLLTESPPQTLKPESKGVPGYSIDAAVKHIDANAHTKSQGRCARYVREAIEAGGAKIPLPRPVYAKDYGPVLSKLGFVKVAAVAYTPLRGDIVVLKAPTGQVAGHIQMYNGTKWVSDFIQGTDIYPGPGYRKDKVGYEVFRP